MIKYEKKKFLLAVSCLVLGLIVNIFVSRIIKSGPRPPTPLSIGLFIGLLVVTLIPMVVSMFYVTGTLNRFALEKIVRFSEQLNARGVSARQRKSNGLMVWLALSCGFGILVGSFNLPKFWILSQRGVTTVGKVVRVDNGAIVNYEFQVHGNKYAGSWRPSSREELIVGARASVLYDPQNPQTSILGTVEPLLPNELAFVGSAMLIFPTLIVFGLKKVTLPQWKRELAKTE